MSATCPVCQAPVKDTDQCCPSCGFKLLGSTERFYPVAFEQEGDMPVPEVQNQAIFRVVRGPKTGVTYELADDEITIGRNPQCTIFLNDMTVSRLHASITHEGGSYVIHDEDSFNGVWVNNQSVQTKTLVPGDYVQIGTFCLLFELA